MTPLSGPPAAPLALSAELVMARGTSRICYRHPLDPGKCIKVDRPGSPSTPNRIEFDYYARLRKRRVPMDHIAACHGWVETDQGRGLVFDRITWDDSPGSPSVNLAAAIREKKLAAEDVRQGVRDFVRYLQHYRILWTDENPVNLGVTVRPGLRFIILDGLGGRKTVNPRYAVLRSVPLLARLYTGRKIVRLHRRIDALLAP